MIKSIFGLNFLIYLTVGIIGLYEIGFHMGDLGPGWAIMLAGSWYLLWRRSK